MASTLRIGRLACLAASLVALIAFAGGCSTHDHPTYYEDESGVHTEYYNYPSQKYHEEDYYYRGSPYRDPHPYHHHGYGSGYSN